MTPPRPNPLLISLLVILVGAITLFYASLISHQPPLTPLGSTTAKIDGYSGSPKIKYGFLPYWNLAAVSVGHLEGLTHLSYFSLTPNADGSLKTHTNPRELDPGWFNLNKESTLALFAQAKQAGLKTHVVISQFDDQVIVSLLENPTAHEKLTSEILQLISKYGFDGVNIDFEPTSGLANESANFTAFITTLNHQLKTTNPALQVFLDIYPGAAGNPGLWQLSELTFLVDQFVVMTYDYHRKSSLQAGPIAPLYSQSDHNILHHLSQVTKVVPLELVILGIPNYGYRWQTVSSDLYAKTFPNTGQTVKFKDIANHLAEWEYQSFWDQDTYSMWYATEKKGLKYQLHFDSPEAIILKHELVNQSSMAGIAIWAIGYDNHLLDINNR
jgi:spore germination protein